MSTLLPDMFKSLGGILLPVFGKQTARQLPAQNGACSVLRLPAHRLRLPPGEARIRRESAAVQRWLGTRS